MSTTPATKLDTGRLTTGSVPSPVSTDYLTIGSGFQLEVNNNVIPGPILPVETIPLESTPVTISTDGWLLRSGLKLDSFNPVQFYKMAGDSVILRISLLKSTPDAVTFAIQPSENSYCTFSGQPVALPTGAGLQSYDITITSKGVADRYLEFRTDLSFLVGGVVRKAALYATLQRG